MRLKRSPCASVLFATTHCLTSASVLLARKVPRIVWPLLRRICSSHSSADDEVAALDATRESKSLLPAAVAAAAEEEESDWPAPVKDAAA